RETERMLEVSATNPEALIDFIDFIFSLPIEEQCNLINSLQTDYQAEYLINIYIPSIWADPPEPVKEQIIKNIGKTRSKRSALLLSELQEYYTPEIDPSGEIQKIIKKSINELKLAGIYRPELFDAYRDELTHPHPIVENSKIYQCYATLSDGIGNQGLMISRQKENGDIVMMSVAINDIHGIIDCFGFYQLSETDFNRIVEKFHEESTKILIHPAYCLHKLKKAESMNQGNRFRLPYEYTCWKVLLDDVIPEAFDPILACKDWANEKWEAECGNLYQHPDFHTWFLERGDHPVMNGHLNKVQGILEGVLESEQPPSAVIEQFQSQLETLAFSMVQALYDSDWKEFFLERLAEAAYLLNHQKTTTFSRLAATEVIKIKAVESEKNPLESPKLKTGFILQYAKRCLEEELLRLKQQPHQSKQGLGLMDLVLENWTLPD
ncbi:MAG: hypothetical protein K2X66_16230, partial [Cyanobacteria bacterium]|nr:hypothetical protein [Cyanobacteriota bacterium]